MRLYILPISTTRALLYCRKSPSPFLRTPSKTSSYLDRITAKASSKWLQWETAKGGWKAWTTRTGNKLLQGLPFEEWGLKSVGPVPKIGAAAASIQRQGDESHSEKEQQSSSDRLEHEAPDLRTRIGEEVVEQKGELERRVRVEYPASIWDEARVLRAVGQYGSEERQGFHRKWMIWSVVGMPFTIPFVLVPM